MIDASKMYEEFRATFDARRIMSPVRQFLFYYQEKHRIVLNLKAIFNFKDEQYTQAPGECQQLLSLSPGKFLDERAGIAGGLEEG